MPATERPADSTCDNGARANMSRMLVVNHTAGGNWLFEIVIRHMSAVYLEVHRIVITYRSPVAAAAQSSNQTGMRLAPTNTCFDF